MICFSKSFWKTCPNTLRHGSSCLPKLPSNRCGMVSSKYTKLGISSMPYCWASCGLSNLTRMIPFRSQSSSMVSRDAKTFSDLGSSLSTEVTKKDRKITWNENIYHVCKNINKWHMVIVLEHSGVSTIRYNSFC